MRWRLVCRVYRPCCSHSRCLLLPHPPSHFSPSFSPSLSPSVPPSDITLTVPQTLHRAVDFYQNYTVSVNTSSAPTSAYSSFSLQVHSQLYHVFLASDSSPCNGTYDMGCTASGSNVGLVQVWNKSVKVYLFHTRVECDPGECSTNSTVSVLFAVTGIPVKGICNRSGQLVTCSTDLPLAS